jgi:aspartyl/asparaginyl beta-hydroxylase
MKMVIKYLQLPFVFSVEQLARELNTLSAGWVAHFNQAHYSGEWGALPLRSVNGSLTNIVPAIDKEDAFRDTALMRQCPYIQTILKQFDCEQKAVRLLKLSAGAVIKEHNDKGLCYEQGEARIHIPVTTNDQVEFYLDNERILMKPGQCWYLNFDLPHRIANNGTTDRIHLVIDLIVNEQIKKMFEEGTPDQRKMIPAKGKHSENEKLEIIKSLREMNTAVSIKLADEMAATLKTI